MIRGIIGSVFFSLTAKWPMNGFVQWPVKLVKVIDHTKEILDICLAQIRFVINIPKQVIKSKDYIATLITLIMIIRSWTERDLF
jgi:hypothetical protein